MGGLEDRLELMKSNFENDLKAYCTFARVDEEKAQHLCDSIEKLQVHDERREVTFVPQRGESGWRAIQAAELRHLYLLGRQKMREVTSVLQSAREHSKEFQISLEDVYSFVYTLIPAVMRRVHDPECESATYRLMRHRGWKEAAFGTGRNVEVRNQYDPLKKLLREAIEAYSSKARNIELYTKSAIHLADWIPLIHVNPNGKIGSNVAGKLMFPSKSRRDIPAGYTPIQEKQIIAIYQQVTQAFTGAAIDIERQLKRANTLLIEEADIQRIFEGAACRVFKEKDGQEYSFHSGRSCQWKVAPPIPKK